jgi:hypothetical protein
MPDATLAISAAMRIPAGIHAHEPSLRGLQLLRGARK